MSTTTSPGLYQIKVGPRTFYYGQSQNLQNREHGHLHYLRKGTHSNRQLQRSFNKHGEGSFSFKALLICEIEELNRYEQALLDAHHGTPGCANVAKDAEAPTRGLKHSEETKEKMSETFWARWNSPAARRKRRKGYKARKNQSEALKARWADPEYRKRVGEAVSRGVRKAKSKPVEVTWTSGETTIFPSMKAVGEHLGHANGTLVSKWLAGLRKIPKDCGITSLTKIS